jgi:uncharacterized protein YdeI (BOF family)
MFVNFNKMKLIPFFCLWGFFIFSAFFVQANQTDHLVISAIQITQGTGKTNHDFIEIYNPTEEDINLKGYRLVKRSKAGASDVSIKSWTSDTFIKACGWRLWASSDDPSFPNSVDADDFTKSTLANNNGVALRKGSKDTGEIIDSIAWGSAENIFIEEKVFSQNPKSNEFLVRKSDGEQDTDNNENDFEIILNFTPRNSENQGNLEDKGDEDNNHSPIADAGGDMEIFVNQEIEFDASDSSDPDNDEISFFWDFGDEKNGQGINPIHSYNTAGEFKVILTVSDGGLSSTDSLIVKVIETSYSQDIIINEILPNPEGSDTAAAPNGEWIELYNRSSQKINLAGWKLDDLISSGSKPYAIDSKIFIEPNEYLVFYYGQTKICLNNNGDEVNLINPQGKIISACSYQEKSDEQTSLARGKDGQWYWSVEPTPNKENLITIAEDFSEEDENDDENSEEFSEKESDDLKNSKENPKEASISEVKNLAKGTWVRTRGTVSAPPKVLSDKVFYISSEESGIQIYSSKGDFPEINSGDFVEIVGKTSEANNEKKINIYSADDIEILDADFPPEPKIIKTGEINEALEGSLVKIEGQVSRSAGNVFYVNDGSDEIKIYIRSATGIKKPKTSKGTWVTIAGIVSETSTGYRILPRFQEDVLVGKVAGSNILPQAGADLFFILILSLTGLLITILGFKKRKIIYEILFAGE